MGQGNPFYFFFGEGWIKMYEEDKFLGVGWMEEDGS